MFHFWDWLPQPWGYLATLLHIGLVIWMAVDASRRGADPVWFWIILFMQPIGAWVYFFAFKLRDLHRPRIGRVAHHVGRRRLSLDELRYHAERTPTVTNRLALAERLM